MKTVIPLMAAAVVLAAAAHAQERSAGQAYDAQVNWSALGSKIDLVSTQNKAIAASVESINTKLDAMAACGRQKKFWTGTGCLADDSTPPKTRTEVGTFTLKGGTAWGTYNLGKVKYPVADNAFCKTRGYQGLQSAQHYSKILNTQTQCGGGEGMAGCRSTNIYEYGTTAICYKLVPVR